MRKLSIGLRALVGLVFLFQGVMKLAGVQNEWRDDLGVAPWFWAITGIVQLAGAVGLLSSLRYDWLTIPAAGLFVVVMIGALATHVRAGDPVSQMIFATVMALASAAIVAIEWRSDTGVDEDSMVFTHEAQSSG